jgi:hypothetical protein
MKKQTENNIEKAGLNRLAAPFAYCVMLGTVVLLLLHSYFNPRSVKTLGCSSAVAKNSWQAEQSLVMVWPSALV